MNAWYQSINGPQQAPPQAQPAPFRMMNPMQRMNWLMQAMQNPAQTVLNAFPDIPQNIRFSPDQILRYLQETRGITNEQIRQMLGTAPGMMR